MKFAVQMGSANQHFTNGRVIMAGLMFSNSPKWKKPNEVVRRSQMEKELSQYKKIVAELTLENVVMKDVISKKF